MKQRNQEMELDWVMRDYTRYFPDVWQHDCCMCPIPVPSARVFRITMDKDEHVVQFCCLNHARFVQQEYDLLVKERKKQGVKIPVNFAWKHLFRKGKKPTRSFRMQYVGVEGVHKPFEHIRVKNKLK